jgi:20S proteasome subunit alpha 5
MSQNSSFICRKGFEKVMVLNKKPGCRPSCSFKERSMYLNRSEYDRGVNTFSPQGRLFQVEYAIEAIKLGATAVGIQTAEGVVLAVERRTESKLMVPGSVKKLVKLDAHMGCAMSGLVADARTLVNHARVQTQNHWFTFNERMQVRVEV